MRTICECAWSPAWWVGVGNLFLAQRIDIRIYRVHTKDMTTTRTTTDAELRTAARDALLRVQAREDRRQARLDELNPPIVYATLAEASAAADARWAARKAVR